jgi:hypothetical protein
LYATPWPVCSAWLNVMAGIERFDFRVDSNLSMMRETSIGRSGKLE